MAANVESEYQDTAGGQIKDFNQPTIFLPAKFQSFVEQLLDHLANC
jgi:hypothetical protein